MKLISESIAIKQLANVREEFRRELAKDYEHRARPCSSCTTPGECCLDEHFVNVRVSRLEVTAIRTAVSDLHENLRSAVFARLERIEPDAEFYSCPLYHPGIGCVVHNTAKPMPCIAHACYERKEDLPPDELLSARELEIDELNRKVFGRGQTLIPIHASLR